MMDLCGCSKSGRFRSQKDAEEFSKNYVGRHTFLRGLGDGVEQAEVSGKQHFRAYYGPWKTSDKPFAVVPPPEKRRKRLSGQAVALMPARLRVLY